MNPRACCHRSARDRHLNSPPATLKRRGIEAAGIILSGATLVLMPKCPICVAAYVAMFSGIGISVAGATVLRTSLLILCITGVAFVAAKWILQAVARKKAD